MNVVLYFSGSVILDENTLLQSITTSDSPPIKLSEWLKLPEEQQDNYILKSAIEAIQNGVDDEWEQLNLTKEV